MDLAINRRIVSLHMNKCSSVCFSGHSVALTHPFKAVVQISLGAAHAELEPRAAYVVPLA